MSNNNNIGIMNFIKVIIIVMGGGGGGGMGLLGQWLLYILGPITSLYFNTVTDEDLRGQNVLHYHPFILLRDCSISAPTPFVCRSNEPLPD